MTTRPRLKIGRHLLRGVAAVALFGVMVAAFLTAEFPAPKGFGPGSITASIGYAMFGLSGQIPSENFLVAFEIIDVVLVAALAAAVMLARREGSETLLGPESDSSSNEAVRADGGSAGTEGDR